jgi:hypothetical protein
LVQLYETIRAAEAFCRNLSSSNVLDCLLTHAGDAVRLTDLSNRLFHVIESAEFTLPPNEQLKWRAAQEADYAAWVNQVDVVERVCSDTAATPHHVPMKVLDLLGCCSPTPEQLAQTTGILEKLALLRPNMNFGCHLSTAKAPWDVDLGEVEFFREQDELGDLGRVSLGKGFFGNVYCGL